MTRAARDYTAWKLKEIEGDPEGYKAAQQAHRQDEAAAEAKRAEDRDRASFEAAYVAAGGTRTGAGDAYRQKRNEQAVEAARFADEAAIRQQRGATMGKV